MGLRTSAGKPSLSQICFRLREGETEEGDRGQETGKAGGTCRKEQDGVSLGIQVALPGLGTHKESASRSQTRAGKHEPSQICIRVRGRGGREERGDGRDPLQQTSLLKRVRKRGLERGKREKGKAESEWARGENLECARLGTMYGRGSGSFGIGCCSVELHRQSPG